MKLEWLPVKRTRIRKRTKCGEMGEGFFLFLLNGLKGLADDGEKDGVITLQELSAYLAKKVPDEVSKITQKDQNPVSLGKPNKLMAIVNDSILKSLLRNRSFLQQVGICPFPDPFLQKGP